MIWTTKTNQPGKVLVYHAPKCASRTLAGYLALADDPGLIEAHSEWFAPSRNRSEGEYHELRKRVNVVEPKHSWWPSCDVPAVTFEGRDGLRVCVEVEPVRRFISGWRNRVLFHNDLGFAEGQPKPSLAEFGERFAEFSEHPHIRGHFRPQCAFYGRDRAMFDRVFPIDDVGEGLRAWMSEMLGVALPALHLQQSGDVPRPVVDEGLAEAIRRIPEVAMDMETGWGAKE